VLPKQLRPVAKLARKGAWEGERLRWRLFHPVTLGARVILVKDERVLLIQHTYRPHWYFPGGGVEKQETLADAARREALEEAGAVVRELTLLGMYASFEEEKSDHVAVFVSQDFDHTELEPDDEIARREWFPLNALPGDLSPGTQRRIDEYLSGGPARAGQW